MKPNISAKDISQMLARDTLAVCNWLIPGGKAAGPEYCTGSTAGGQGQSLRVHLTGDKAGIWADFAGTAKGDLLDLIREAKGVAMPEAIRLAKEYLGVEEPKSIIQKKTFTKPKKENLKNVRKATEQTAVMAYLTGERKLSKEVVAKYRISETDTEMAFPSFTPAGELDSIKYIGLVREGGKKVVRQEKGCAPALFGWQALSKDCRQVVITEGQIDAMTWSHFGFDALSVPNGVGDLDGWIDYEWENLQQFDQIYLSFDGDKPGQDAVEQVAKRLGIHRVRSVVFPEHKDANEALMEGMDQAYFFEAIAKAKAFKPKQLKSPLDFRDLVVEEFYPSGGEKPGFAPETLRQQLRFLPGQFTIWTGISSHGKSNLLGQLMLEGAAMGHRSAIASMEMPGQKTLARMLRSAAPASDDVPSEKFIDCMLQALVGRMWIFDLRGCVKLDEIIELMTYTCARYSVTQFVIDSLMKLDVDSDDNEAQRVALNRIAEFAATHEVHVHIVCHARKGANEDEAPGKMDVKGSVDIINQCDNLVSVWRNKPKEERAREGKRAPDDDKKPDCIAFIRKNRESGEEGHVWLWFNRRRNKYLAISRAGSVIDVLLIPQESQFSA